MGNALASRASHPGPAGCGSSRFDAFLSFERGSEDARKSSLDHEPFPDRLHASLGAAGVSVKGRDKSLAVGSSSRLPDPAARQSKICIPIISKDYLCREQCLRELAQMMERRRSGQQKVLPIFDGVDPRDVRHQAWNSVKARHPNIEGLQRALKEVGYLHGWKVTDGRGEELAEIVVQTVLTRLRSDVPRSRRIVQYNVFLNFRGTDTREGITKELYTNLVDAGVSVFKDDTSIPIGEDFRSELLTAITRSTIYIAVLSEEYGTSKWCRHELMKMLECCQSTGHVVFPIFYGVDPSDVRHLRGRFGRAVHSRMNLLPGMDVTGEGHRVLREVCQHRGWDSLHGRYKPTSTYALFLLKFTRSSEDSQNTVVVHP